MLKPAFDGTGVAAATVWIAVAWLMLFGCLRALGIMVRRYYSGVAGERVMATLRRQVSDRYRDLALQYHRETPTGELLAHMEADVKAAVDVFWPVPFATGVIVLVVLAMIQMLRVDPWLALVGALLFPALMLMNRSFAKRMQEPGPARPGGHRRGVLRRARIDRRSARRQDPRARGRRDREAARRGRAPCATTA